MGLRIKRPWPPLLVFDISKFLNMDCATRYDHFLKSNGSWTKDFSTPPNFLKTDIQRKGWHNFNKHPKRGCVVIFREFYANLIEQEGYKVFFREKQVSFNQHMNNEFY